jgi:hypothetical protein
MKAVAIAILACGTAIGCVLIASQTYHSRNRGSDLVTVTGLAKRDFVSDLIAWKGSFVRRDRDLRAAYEGLAKDLASVKQFCAQHAITESEAVFSSVEIEKEYEQSTDKTGRSTREFKGYLLTQRVQVESGDVDRIERFSREVTGLIDLGVEVYSEPPEYYYTKLGELKLEMIAAATTDGKARARLIAENAGATLGRLRYSSLGVFQITVPNSSADFSGGCPCER